MGDVDIDSLALMTPGASGIRRAAGFRQDEANAPVVDLQHIRLGYQKTLPVWDNDVLKGIEIGMIDNAVGILLPHAGQAIILTGLWFGLYRKRPLVLFVPEIDVKGFVQEID